MCSLPTRCRGWKLWIQDPGSTCAVGGGESRSRAACWSAWRWFRCRPLPRTRRTWVAGLWDGLRDRGWLEGQTLSIEQRTSASRSDVPVLVAQLVGLRLDMLVTLGTENTVAAERATYMIPIVFTSVSDPVSAGIVASLARPGGNVTASARVQARHTTASSWNCLKALCRGSCAWRSSLTQIIRRRARSLGGDAGGGRDARRAGASAGRRLGGDLASAYADAARWPAHGVIVRGGGLVLTERARIAELAVGIHLPAIYQFTENVDAGGLMSYGTSQRDTYRRAAIFVDKILRGAKPADLSVEQLTTVEFAVNVKAAQALGLTLPPDVAAQVTEWVP
jgi:putative ABC transport system substrate-binding protein